MKKAYSLSLTLLLFLILHTMSAFAACYDPRDVIKKAKDPKSHIPIIAMHRGLWGDGNRLPENSMGAFIAADKMCMEGIETDVRLTKDNVPIMMHDDTYGRTTDVYKLKIEEDAKIKELKEKEAALAKQIAEEQDQAKKKFEKQAHEELRKKRSAAEDEQRYLTEAEDVGYNPKIHELNWQNNGVDWVKKLNLLITPNDKPVPHNVTGYHILRVKDFYDEYLANKMSVVVFLEVKKKEAMPIVLKQLFSDQRDYNQNFGGKQMYATELTVIKFNATMYPTPQQYKDELNKAREAAGAGTNIPNPIAFPAFNGNNLGTYIDDNGTPIKDDYEGSIKKWIDDKEIRIGIELNLKVKDGILQEFYNKAIATNKVVVGTFNAIPDYMRVNPTADKDRVVTDLISKKDVKLGDAFYRGENGGCCQGLQAMLGTKWKNSSGKEIQDSDDKRWDPAFIVGDGGDKPAFRIVTTDDYNLMKKAFDSKKKNNAVEAFKTSPLVTPLVFHRDKGADTFVYNYNLAGTASADIKLPDTKISSSPATITFERRTYVFFIDKGKVKYYESSPDTRVSDADNKITWGTSTVDAASGTKNHVFNTGCNGGTYSPAVVVHDGRLWVFYKSDSSDEIKSCFKDGEIDRGQWYEGKLVPNVETTSVPAVTVFDGKLYLFYRKNASNSKKDGNIYSKTYADGKWSPSEFVAWPAFTAPSVTTLNGKLYLFYQNSSLKLVYKTFNGAKWEDAKNVQSDATNSASETTLHSYYPAAFASQKKVWIYYDSEAHSHTLSINGFNPDNASWDGESNIGSELYSAPSVF